MKKFILFLSFTLAFIYTVGAQTNGSWFPAGADLSYPRTLLKASQMAAVQASLASNTNSTIYAGLYSNATAAPPTDNATTDNRRTRATMAKNAAFVVLMDKNPASGTLVPLTGTARTALINKTKILLENVNTTVDAATSYTNWQWRSKELIDYLVAYDLLCGAGESPASLALSKTKLQLFAANLYEKSVTPYTFFFYSISFYKDFKNNHVLMTAAALGLAAIVLNDATGTDPKMQPVNWINTGLYNLDNLLWRDEKRLSDPEKVAGYAEGPYYFKYAFLNCLPFIRAMGNFLPDGSLNYTYNNTTRSIRNPYFDPAYDRLYDWITTITMPDGRFPALEDSYIDMGMPELVMTGKSKYVRPMYFNNLTSNQLNSLHAQLRDITVDMRAAFLAAQISPATLTYSNLTALPHSGNLVFRSGNDSLANYLHLYGKNGLALNNSGGHNHGDASSFILHAQGQLLALDAGYLNYNRRAEVGNANNHNLVLVDKEGPAIGTEGSANDAEAFIQNMFQNGTIAYGEVRTSYRNTNIIRKTISVRNSYFLMADFMQADATHNYTWQLHGYGLENGTAATGTFTDSLTAGEGIWQKNNVHLKAHVTATGGATAYIKATNKHELTYNTPEDHTTMLVEKQNVAQTQFLAALHPYTTEALQIKTTSTPTTAALTITGPDYKDMAWTQTDSLISTFNTFGSTVSSDAQLTLFSVQAADSTFSQAFLEHGTILQKDTTLLIQSTKRAAISLVKVNDTTYNAYVSRATMLFLAMENPPASVTGDSISTFAYNADKHQLLITFTGPSACTIILTTPAPAPPITVPTPIAEPIDLSGIREHDAVLLSWQSSPQPTTIGFAVQRRSEAESEFKQIGLVKAGGITDYSFRDSLAPATPVYYRLQQLHTDSTFTYSSIISLPESSVLGISLPEQTANQPTLLVGPVPADRYLDISFSDPKQSVMLRLLTQDGRIQQQTYFKKATRLPVGTLAPGLYYLQAHNKAGNLIAKPKKIIIVH